MSFHELVWRWWACLFMSLTKRRERSHDKTFLTINYQNRKQAKSDELVWRCRACLFVSLTRWREKQTKSDELIWRWRACLFLSLTGLSIRELTRRTSRPLSIGLPFLCSRWHSMILLLKNSHQSLSPPWQRPKDQVDDQYQYNCGWLSCNEKKFTRIERNTRK